MRILSHILLSGIFGFSIMSYAAVDIKSGAFLIQRSDQALNQELSGLAIHRTYSSFNDFDGLFGYGWCSELETTLIVVAKGQIAVSECGAGLLKIYNSSDYAESNADAAIISLLEKMKVSGKPVTAEQKKEISQSRVLRTKMMRKFRVGFSNEKGTYFLNPFPNEEQVVFSNGLYTRKTAGGLIQTFDKDGRLLLQRHIRGDSVKLNYGPKGLTSVVSNRGQELSFRLDENGHVIELRGPQGITKYAYSNDGLLVKVKEKKSEENYLYSDDLMTSYERSKKKTVIKYNPVTRFVANLQSENCSESYNYNVNKSALNFKVEVNSVCKSVSKKLTYDFQYQLGKDGTLFQKKMTATDGKGGTTSAEFIGDGMPSKILRRGQEFKFSYDSKNRIITKESTQQRVDYGYSNAGNLLTAKIQIKNKRSPASAYQQFNYDKDLRLESVILKDDVIRYSYDKKDRLTNIISKSGSQYSIKNDPLTGKVQRITAKGYGHFEMKYAKDGRLVRSDWKGDPQKGLAVIDRYELLREPYKLAQEFGVPK